MKKWFKDTYLIFVRNVQISFRNPVWIMFGLFQPLCFLLFFAPLLEKLSEYQADGGQGYLTMFIPGLLAMISLYSTAFAGFRFIADMRAGVIERLLVTPISRSAIVIGRSLRDVCLLLVQSALILSVAWFMGLQAPLLGVMLSLLFVMLTGFSVSLASYSLAFILRSEDALAPVVNFFLLPVQLLAGIMLPLYLAPQWLQTVAVINPLLHVVKAMRFLFAGSYAEYVIAYSFIGMLVLASISVWYATRLLRQVQ